MLGRRHLEFFNHVFVDIVIVAVALGVGHVEDGPDLVLLLLGHEAVGPEFLERRGEERAGYESGFDPLFEGLSKLGSVFYYRIRIFLDLRLSGGGSGVRGRLVLGS